MCIQSSTQCAVNISYVPQNCNSDTLEGIAYASRQLNSASVSLNFFTLIMLCELEQLSDVKVALLKYFDSTETAYIYNKSAQQGVLCMYISH